MRAPSMYGVQVGHVAVHDHAGPARQRLDLRRAYRCRCSGTTGPDAARGCAATPPRRTTAPRRRWADGGSRRRRPGRGAASNGRPAPRTWCRLERISTCACGASLRQQLALDFADHQRGVAARDHVELQRARALARRAISARRRPVRRHAARAGSAGRRVSNTTRRLRRMPAQQRQPLAHDVVAAHDDAVEAMAVLAQPGRRRSAYGAYQTSTPSCCKRCRVARRRGAGRSGRTPRARLRPAAGASG